MLCLYLDSQKNLVGRESQEKKQHKIKFSLSITLMYFYLIFFCFT